MTEHNTPHRFNDDSINIETLADAQDGSEILFAVAQLLESQHGKDYGYALLLRRNAHAIRDITDHLQPWAIANEQDPALKAIWHETSPREQPAGANAHKTELTRRLGIKT